MTEADSAKRAQIAERLKEARKLAGLSQGHVAKILGLHRPSVSEMEAGNRRVSADELARLAEIYDVSVAWLLGETPETLDAQDPRLELAARELTKLKPDDLERLLKLLAAMRSEFHRERRRSLMNVMRTTKPSFNRRALATQAMQAASGDAGEEPSWTKPVRSASTGCAKRSASGALQQHQYGRDVSARASAAHPPLRATAAATPRL